jgi:hypothetical protein
MYNGTPNHQQGQPMAPEEMGAIIAALAAIAISPFALVAAIPLVFVKRRYLREFLIGTLAALVLTLALARPALAHVQDAFAHLRHSRVTMHPRHALAAAWPSIRAAWLLMLPTAPVMALVFDLVRGKSIDEKTATDERRKERARRRRMRSARKRARKIAESTAPEDTVRGSGDKQTLILAAKASGEWSGFEDRSGRAGLMRDALLRHVAVIGGSGSGKTETLLRIAYLAAQANYSVFYIDAKADRPTMERFRALMAAAATGLTGVFPDYRFDAFRGDSRAVFNRLIEIVRYSEEGDGAYYRDVAKRILATACFAEAGPPRSSDELIARLAPAELRRVAPALAADLSQRELAGVRLRYEAFFAALDGQLDAGLAFDDRLSYYVLLDGLSLKEEAGSLARLMLADFAHFAKHRKLPTRRALLILDEFSAIAESANVVDLVERLRSHNVGIVLAPQAEEGLGESELARARIIQSCETVILHQTKRPESLASLAGTRREVQSSLQHEDGRATGTGSGRSQHVFTVDPNEVRRLGPGEAFVIRHGRGARVQIAQAPPVPRIPPLVTGRVVLPPRGLFADPWKSEPLADDLRL